MEKRMVMKGKQRLVMMVLECRSVQDLHLNNTFIFSCLNLGASISPHSKYLLSRQKLRDIYDVYSLLLYNCISKQTKLTIVSCLSL